MTQLYLLGPASGHGRVEYGPAAAPLRYIAGPLVPRGQRVGGGDVRQGAGHLLE